MPKSRGRRKQPIPSQPKLPPIPPAAATPQMLQAVMGYNPAGPMEQRDVVASRDGWSEYELDDGTKIRAKCSIVDAKKAVGQYAPNGDPIYVLQMAMVNNIIAPANLKKKS